MTAPQRVVLSDGRVVTYATYGAPLPARWVVYVHGFPGSRLEGKLWESAATARGIGVLAPDRPGFGSSDDAPGRCVADWGRDMREVFHLLRIPRAALIGVSGGGPYALACAAVMPESISSLQLVSSLAPPREPGVLAGMVAGNRLMFRLIATLPWLGQGITRFVGASWAAAPQLCLAWFRAFVSSPDRLLLDEPVVRQLMLANIRTAFERGSRGAARDFAVLSAEWRVDPEAIAVPTTVWHGDVDTYVPPVMGDYLARSIPGATLERCRSSGHLLVLERIDDILERALALP